MYGGRSLLFLSKLYILDLPLQYLYSIKIPSSRTQHNMPILFPFLFRNGTGNNKYWSRLLTISIAIFALYVGPKSGAKLSHLQKFDLRAAIQPAAQRDIPHAPTRLLNPFNPAVIQLPEVEIEIPPQ